MGKENSGNQVYSLDKNSFSWFMIKGVIYFLVGYYLFLGVFTGFLAIVKATDLNNEYLTQNVILKPIFQLLRACDFFKANFNEISIELFFKSIMIFIYTIIFILLLKDILKSHLYEQLYGAIQFNPNNNPTKNLTMVTKISGPGSSPSVDRLTYIIKIITGLIFILAYPFIVLYFIRCYDVQNNIVTQLAVVSMLFVPVIYYATTHMATMKALYKSKDILDYGKKYVEEKDYEYVDMFKKKFNYHFDTVLFIPLLILFISILYFFMYYEFDYENPLMKSYVLILLIGLPIILLIFNYNVLFSCYTQDNECGIFRNGLIKYEVYHNGIKSFYDALVKYNYLCFPR